VHHRSILLLRSQSSQDAVANPCATPISLAPHLLISNPPPTVVTKAGGSKAVRCPPLISTPRSDAYGPRPRSRHKRRMSAFTLVRRRCAPQRTEVGHEAD
jgi:hypothetical protein